MIEEKKFQVLKSANKTILYSMNENFEKILYKY